MTSLIQSTEPTYTIT